jgi:hypothetical protein
MLNTFYNWVIEEETLHGWFRSHGFMDIVTLNASEKQPSSFHVFGRKRGYIPALRDDVGSIIARPIPFKRDRAVPLKGPFRKEIGHAWQTPLPELAAQSDSMDDPYKSKLVLLENGEVLGQRHALHDTIRVEGRGAYSHWLDYLLFSTSDNTDPRDNNRTYEIAIADSSE